ncbi:hypothetical protein BAA08_00070 [Bizionia sp. APA-3]|nr:hypothetical protein BAA08_00070 [Bizionia sp. APA-3]
MKVIEKLFIVSHNQKVPGSSPGGTTNKIKPFKELGGFFYFRVHVFYELDNFIFMKPLFFLLLIKQYKMSTKFS